MWNKNQELDNGVVVSFWKQKRAVIDFETKKVEIYVSGYLSEETYLAGKKAIVDDVYQVDYDPESGLAKQIEADIVVRAKEAQDEVANEV